MTHPTAFLLEKLSVLSHRLHIAYAAGCAEHVLPLFEQLRGGDRVREALDLAWSFAFGAEVSVLDLNRAYQAADSAIPAFADDPSPRSELSINAAIPVLETILSIRDGAPGPAMRAGAGAVGTLSIAAMMLTPGLEEDIGDIRQFDPPSAVSPQTGEEWRLQTEMLEHLSSRTPPAINQAWKRFHHDRGSQVLDWWKASSNSG